GNKQEPYVTGSLGGNIVSMTSNAPKPVPQFQASEAERAWALAKDTTSIPALDAFIRRFGDTYYGDLAKVRLAELKQAEDAREATKNKVEEEVQAKVEAERQQLAVLKAEQDRKWAEAEKRRAEAVAKKNAEDIARAEAEAESQRIALLQQEE